jgi:tetratricopeptide (TPR) repeat protein
MLTRAKAHAHYGAAIIYELDNKTEQALQEFQDAAMSDPGDEALVLEVSQRLLRARQPEKTLEVLERAVARPGATGAIFARLGLVYAQLGKIDEALAANRTAIKKSPQLLAGYRNLFYIFLANKQPDEALNILSEASKLNSEGADFLIGLSDLYGNYMLQYPTQRETVRPKSLDLLNRAAALNPTDLQTRLRLADGLYALGNNDEAAKLYLGLLNQIGDLPVLRVSVRSKLADIYYHKKDLKRAAEQLEAIVHDDPSNAMAYYFLGQLAAGERHWVEAADYLKKALLFNPKMEQAYYDLARAQIAANRAADAVTTLETARKKYPQSFSAEFWLGFAHEQLKEYDEARRHFTAAEVMVKAETTNELSAEFYFQFGAVCERDGDYVQAAKHFEKCLELRPDFPEAQNYLGYMWAEHGQNLARARDLIEKAVKADPKSPAYLDSLAWVLYKQKQPKAALDYILKAVQLSKEPDATLYEHLGDIYAALKQMDDARSAWRKSLAVEKSDPVQKKLDASQGQ